MSASPRFCPASAASVSRQRPPGRPPRFRCRHRLRLRNEHVLMLFVMLELWCGGGWPVRRFLTRMTDVTAHPGRGVGLRYHRSFRMALAVRVANMSEFMTWRTGGSGRCRCGRRRRWVRSPRTGSARYALATMLRGAAWSTTTSCGRDRALPRCSTGSYWERWLGALELLVEKGVQSYQLAAGFGCGRGIRTSHRCAYVRGQTGKWSRPGRWTLPTKAPASCHRGPNVLRGRFSAGPVGARPHRDVDLWESYLTAMTHG